MAGNLPVTLTTFETELQAKINTVGGGTSIEDIISYYRAGENIPTINNTALTAEVQSRLNAVSSSTTAEEFLTLAASFGKVSNTNQSDLQSALLAIADIPTNSELNDELESTKTSILNSIPSSFQTGDIVETTRTVTEDGKALLPLHEIKRTLTTAETAANPLLVSSLPDSIVRTRAANFSKITTNVASFTEGRRFETTAEGTTCYYGDNTSARDLIKFTTSGGEVTLTSFSNGTMDDIACSADGQTVAALASNQTSLGEVRLSRNGGTSFLTLQVASSNFTPKGLHVSQDGTKMAALLRNETGLYQYYYWGDLQNNFTPTIVDITTPLLAARPELTGTLIVTLNAQFSDDCSTLLIAAYSGGNGLYKISAQGTVFEKVNTPVAANSYISTANQGEYGLLDPFNSNNMVTWAGNQFDTVFYTTDMGVTWSPLPDAVVGSVGLNNRLLGYSSMTAWRPELSNGYLFILTGDSMYICIDLVTREVLNMPIGVDSPPAAAFKWNDTLDEITIAYMHSTNEYLCIGEKYTITKALPATNQLFRPFKIVGDTQ